MAVKEEFIDQINKFVESARSLGCDEDEAHFNEVLGKIAKQKPTDQKLDAGSPKD